MNRTHDHAPARTRRRILKVSAALFAGLFLVLVGFQAWQGTATVNTLSAINTDASSRSHELLSRPALVDLFDQPMFDSPAWQDFADTRAADGSEYATGIAKAADLGLDHTVWLPGLNQFFKARASEAAQASQDAVPVAPLSAAAVYYSACSGQRNGDSRETLIAAQTKANPGMPFVADIVDYSSRTARRLSSNVGGTRRRRTIVQSNKVSIPWRCVAVDVRSLSPATSVPILVAPVSVPAGFPPLPRITTTGPST